MPRESKAGLKSFDAGAARCATPEGRRHTQREFERALTQGKLLRSPGAPVPWTDTRALAELGEKAKAKATKAIPIGLPLTDLERAKRIAAKEGTGY